MDKNSVKKIEEKTKGLSTETIEMFKNKSFELNYENKIAKENEVKYRFIDKMERMLVFYGDKTFEVNEMGAFLDIDADLLKAIYKLFEEEGWL